MKKKTLTLLLALVLCLGFTAGALATSGTRTIEVTYKDIKMVVDGTEVALKDGAGNSIEPFLYNGTTYLPVRAVGEAMGKEVTWDGNTNTVYIGQVAKVALPYQVNGADLYDGSKADNFFSVAGTNYQTGVVLKSYSSLSSWHGDFFDGSAIWNTEGFQSMTFSVGHVGSRQRNAKLYVALDGVSAGEYDLTWDGAPQTITVPLNGAANLKLTLVADTVQDKMNNNHYESYGIYNITLS